MIVRFPYGESDLALDLRGLRVAQLRPMAPSAPSAPSELLTSALLSPVAGPGIEELCTTASQVTIVVPDATRKIELPVFIPLLVARIRDHLPNAKITILIACGTHPAPSSEEERSLLGEVPADVEVVAHDARDPSKLTTVGDLDDGTPIRLNIDAVQADLLITIGVVKHHYFAGFGGGPKMIFPGVAGYEEIQRNHSLVLESTDDGFRRHPGCEPGVLQDNPVAEQIASIADLHRPDLAICLVADTQGKTAWAGAGPWREAFSAATEVARTWFEVPPVRYPLVIACGAGAPSDSTLIQAHKSLDAASRFLEDGGELLYLAKMEFGAGSDAMLPFLNAAEPQAILHKLAESWVQYGHTTLRILEKTRRFTIHLHSAFDTKVASSLGFVPTDDPETVLEAWREQYSGMTVGVMAGAPVFPRAD